MGCPRGVAFHCGFLSMRVGLGFAVLVERDKVSFGDEGDNVHYANGRIKGVDVNR
jgi:hypothetical protein